MGSERYKRKFKEYRTKRKHFLEKDLKKEEIKVLQTELKNHFRGRQIKRIEPWVGKILDAMNSNVKPSKELVDAVTKSCADTPPSLPEDIEKVILKFWRQSSMK